MYRGSRVDKQLDCLGTYDTLSEIGKRKREFVCRGAEFKLRLIILRACTCEVISHLYRNNLDVANMGKGSRGRKPQWEVWGARPPLGVQGRSPFRVVSLPLGTIKRNFTAAPRADKERFLCLFQIKGIFAQGFTKFKFWAKSLLSKVFFYKEAKID